MISKKHLLLLLILPIFMLSLAIINVHAPFPAPWVKVFVNQPLGYTPFAVPGTHIQLDIMIVTSGFVDAGSPSIVGWSVDLQIDPAVISINNVAPPPPPFPPPPADAKLIGGVAGYVMYDFGQWYGFTPSILPTPPNVTSGFWDDIAEIYVPLPAFGWGDYMTNTHYGGPAKLITIEVTTKNDARGCLIDLQDVTWLDASNVWHPADVVIDGYYGTPPAGPRYMSEDSGAYNPTQNPVGTMWHELYPAYCNMWEIVGWTDNGDGSLSVSDQIYMANGTGWVYPYHVDAVTTTIHWTFKDIPQAEELGEAEPNDPMYMDPANPVDSIWHELYPNYCKRFKITDWVDNGDGEFGPSDQFAITYEDGFDPPPFPPPGPGPYWAHLDSITTDIIISQKGPPEPPEAEFPLGVTLMMAIAPAIPIVYLWRSRKKVVAK